MDAVTHPPPRSTSRCWTTRPARRNGTALVDALAAVTEPVELGAVIGGTGTAAIG